ncbi:SH3 domain-containing protein [Ancylobacter amanitiformis]|uniref:SH3-like domain-containing protein n=1 Tax=Ancylobacter amanitiformis TaxID=217069 RepID=A0ABU0LWS5_9HYPH|nr:SH3 domain-containing protein [Ancylobacter amanitiformis]MDQ0513060.1 SH3-like domain-containing protein [Ancylobacter amanitiformis]
MLGTILAVTLAAASLLAPPVAVPAGAQDAADAKGPVGRASGLPIPRFLSLKADKVNVRSGPTRDHAVAWVFTRAGLPVEVTAEFETWRRIRDSDGSEGWVYHSMLSSRRTALVSPWLKGEPTTLYASADKTSGVRARLEPGVLGKVEHCDGKWCRFFDNGFDGYVEQERLWGVYPGEKID